MTAQEIYGKVQSFIQMTPEEAAMLFSYCEKVPDNSVLVELGTWKGASACIMSAAKEKSKIFTIDNFRADVYYDRRGIEIEQEIKKTRDNLKELGNITLLMGNNTDCATWWNKELVINLLFIDSDHRYESVKLDIKDWLPFVIEGGFVLFHDYESHEGVLPAVDEFIEAGKLEKVDQVLSLLVTKKL